MRTSLFTNVNELSKFLVKLFDITNAEEMHKNTLI